MSWWPRGEDGEEALLQDTDSDVAEPKDGGKVKVKWTQEEDDKLKALVQKLGPNEWKAIAGCIPNHTEHQCQHRWFKVLDPELVKGPWTKEEDEKVIELVNLYGNKQWAEIAKHLKGRLGKQCRERWHNHLNPNVKKSSWTGDEDLVIYKAHRVLGNRWAEIAKLLPGRTDNAVKNHWNSTIKRKLDMGFYAEEAFAPNELEEMLAQVKDVQVPSCSQDGADKDPEQKTRSSETSVRSSDASPVPQPSSSKNDESPKTAAGSPDWSVDSSGFLSPNSQALKEVLDMVDVDIDVWCNLAAFDLPTDTQSPERHQFRLEGSTLQELSKSSKGELIPISPGGVTPPSAFNRQSRRLITLSPDGNNSMTPKSTPVKILPFSPSQFLNMWTKQDSHDLENPSLTSTPVCSQKAIVTTPLQRDKTPLTMKEKSRFVTPNHKSDMCTTPHTPTPFKNAMEKYGPLHPLPQSPNLEDDINEVILRDAGIHLLDDRPILPETRRKSSHRPPMKKVRKSLALDVVDSHAAPTSRRKSKSVARLNLKEEPELISLGYKEHDNILDQGFLLGPSDSAMVPTTAPPTLMSKEWEMVVCGKTKDQQIMTERARRYLRSLKSHSINRALVLS